ncbi:Alpha/beta hydrolase fold-1 [Ostreococcus tauri]|uniref:Alpha/beta hydrolase fold-1 n=1 Tax=Ostreococcus tauri TaxID=70448 RepID=Q00T86_OSTTA|nr:Alpha/beta hydrolase fold-1 [Ostreococcus tauri]CAL57930.1 Alpha/beta hydrolase fold-1 [Ostreococcus tauri]|eukprot:XP_003083963.1 Alpha/beta hydrolase fold-1 [Ostreococcus tauri]
MRRARAGCDLAPARGRAGAGARGRRRRCGVPRATSPKTLDDARARYGVQERYYEWEGHVIRYTTSGTTGEPLVLIHGFGGNADHWRRNVNALGERRRVYAIDLLGYGYSSKPNPMAEGLKQNEIYCFETWGRQILHFVDEIVGEPAFVACNSVGGVAGLQAAVDAPEKVRGVVLMNISLRGLHITKQPAIIRPFVKALQTTLRETSIGKSFFASVAKERTVKNILKEAYGDSSQVTDELVEAILSPGLRDGAAEVFLDFISYSGGPLPEELLPKCKVPVRMLWGDKDPWENIDQGRKLYASYADKFIPLPGVGHCPQDEAPELVNGLLNEFVDEYASAPA